jgi:hypothetical protein
MHLIKVYIVFRSIVYCGKMGEISKNLVLVIALIVIVVSALGTWTVLNAATSTFGGMQIPVRGEGSVAKGVVNVNVQDGPPEPISGMVSVLVGDGL